MNENKFTTGSGVFLVCHLCYKPKINLPHSCDDPRNTGLPQYAPGNAGRTFNITAIAKAEAKCLNS